MSVVEEHFEGQAAMHAETADVGDSFEAEALRSLAHFRTLKSDLIGGSQGGDGVLNIMAREPGASDR